MICASPQQDLLKATEYPGFVLGRSFPLDSFPRDARGPSGHSTRTNCRSQAVFHPPCWFSAAFDRPVKPLGAAALQREHFVAGLGQTDPAHASCSQASSACQTLNPVGPTAAARALARSELETSCVDPYDPASIAQPRSCQETWSLPPLGGNGLCSQPRTLAAGQASSWASPSPYHTPGRW